MELLIEYGGDINIQDQTGKTALHIAASLGFHSVVEILVSEGADLDVTDSFGRTPLHYVLFFIHNILITDINSVLSSYDEKTCIGGNLECAKLLVLNHCNITATENEGLTCFHFVCLNSKPDILEYLIKFASESSSFDIDVTDDFGRTPLHAAASASCVRVWFFIHFSFTISSNLKQRAA